MRGDIAEAELWMGALALVRLHAIESDADTGPLRHRLQARVRTAGAEHGLGGLQHALTIADRVGAGSAKCCCGRSCHLTNLITIR